MSDPYIGQIMQFGGNFAIRGWAFCDGQLLPINQYSALFSILGTTYGGDGRSTFGLPDQRGRVSMHWGSGPGLSSYTLGQKGGAETVTLTTQQIPSHKHTNYAHPSTGDKTTPVNNVLAAESLIPPDNLYSDQTSGLQAMNSAMGGNTGGGQSHTNIQPYLCVTWLIALEGTYPSRN